MMLPSVLPVAVVAVPALTAVTVVCCGRAPRVRNAVGVVGAAVTLVLVGNLVPSLSRGDILTATLPFEVLPGLRPALRADGFGTVFAMLAAVLWVPAAVYAPTYLREHHERAHTRFLAWYALCLSMAFGVALAADLVTFLLFYELLTIATYPLVVHTGTAQARAAGRRYLAYLMVGGAALVLAVALVAQTVGVLAFVPGGIIGDEVATATVVLIGALFMLALGTKSAVMPLHAWLPAAMVAPTPVSALLHAVAVVKAGVFGFGRLVGFVLGPDVFARVGLSEVLVVLAAVTLVVASLIAIRQDPLKRRLAYSTIAHLAYIVLGFALADRLGIEGGLLHLVNHGVAKITLFLVAGALMVHAHLDRVTQLDGIGRRMPWTMGAFTIGALSLSGLPPFGGMWSKLALVRGAFAADQHAAGIVMAVGGVLTASYLLPIVHRAFLRPDSAEVTALPRTDAALGLRLPLCLTAGLVVILGVADPFGVQQLVRNVSAGVFGGGA